MDRWDEMKAWVDFGADEVAHLVALRPIVEPHIPAVVDHFYATIDRFPEARAVLVDDQQVARLKGTLQRWIAELLGGSYGDAYYQQRLRIGRVHVRVGLPERFVFTAMSQLREDLLEIAFAALGESARPTVHALSKLIDLELGVMSATYLEAHEEVELRSLRDLIVQHMPVTVLCLDIRGVVTAATRPSARLFGQREATGQHYQDFLPEELIEAADLPTHVGRALVTGNELTLPRVAVGRGSSTRYFRVTVLPLEHPLTRILRHKEELTDVVQAEVRAQQAEALARIGALAANIAHEIRNPLAAISSTLQVIAASLPADDRRTPILEKVQEQVVRLDRLVNDLMGYARPAVARSGPVQLVDIARDAVFAAGGGAELVVVGNPIAVADRELLQQIVVNLVQNARDAAGADGNIRISVGPGPEMTVEDDGPGIDEAVVERLFEAFVTTKAKGTGLGLAISRKLAEAMMGTLDLVEDGASGWSGAAFRISLRAWDPLPEARAG